MTYKHNLRNVKEFDVLYFDFIKGQLLSKTYK